MLVSTSRTSLKVGRKLCPLSLVEILILVVTMVCTWDWLPIYWEISLPGREVAYIAFCEIMSYFQVKKLDFHSFVGTGRSPRLPRSWFITHSHGSSQNISFGTTSLNPSFLMARWGGKTSAAHAGHCRSGTLCLGNPSLLPLEGGISLFPKL